MKTLITLALSLFTTASFANFFSVEKKFCDGSEVSLLKEERVYLDVDRGVVGHGHTTEDDCRVVDFQSVILVSDIDGRIEMATVSPIARRSSCSSDKEAYQGIDFFSSTIIGDTLSLYSIDGDCRETALKLKTN